MAEQYSLLLRYLRMLHGEGQVLLREIEHVEDAVLRAAVLAVVYGADHLDDGLALMLGWRPSSKDTSSS